jgi:hypothetical protein
MRVEKFIHERVLESKSGDWLSGEKLLIDSLWLASTSGQTLHPGHFLSVAKKINPDHQPDLESISAYFERRSDWTCSLTLMKCMYPELRPAYVFAKEFFEDLLTVDVTRLAYSMFPIGFSGVFRFPRPIQDEEGDSFQEVCVTVLEATELEDLLGLIVEKDYGPSGKGLVSVERCLLFSWPVIGKRSFGGLFLAAPDNLRLVDSLSRGWDRVEEGVMVDRKYNVNDHGGYVRTILTAMVYVLSGQPDLREHRNVIKKQSPTSQTPVKADKSLSPLPIKLVGYNWKKLPSYGTGVWNVRPFLRFQPCGPGRSEVKLILVREHERRRDSSLVERSKKKTDSSLGAAEGV